MLELLLDTELVELLLELLLNDEVDLLLDPLDELVLAEEDVDLLLLDSLLTLLVLWLLVQLLDSPLVDGLETLLQLRLLLLDVDWLEVDSVLDEQLSLLDDTVSELHDSLLQDELTDSVDVELSDNVDVDDRLVQDNELLDNVRLLILLQDSLLQDSLLHDTLVQDVDSVDVELSESVDSVLSDVEHSEDVVSLTQDSDELWLLLECDDGELLELSETLVVVRL